MMNLSLDVSGILDFIKNHKVLSVCATAVVAYGAWYLKRPRNLPPGPWGYPMIGSLSELMKIYEGSFEELEKKHGDVFCLWLGGDTYWVVLSSYDAIKEGYITRGTDFIDRDTDRLHDIIGQDPLFNAKYDTKYKFSRKVTTQGMRMLLTTKLQGILEQNMDEIETGFSLSGGNPINLQPHFRNLFINSMLSLLLGTEYRHSDKDFLQIRPMIETYCINLFQGWAAYMMPSWIGKWMMSKEIRTTKKFMKELKDVFAKFVDEHQNNGGTGNNQDMINVYLNSQGAVDFDRKNIAEAFMSYLPDTCLTAVEMAMWVVVYLVNHSYVQDDIYGEIVRVYGSGGISLNKRQEMPITEAFIMEVFRVVNPLEVGMMAKPLKSTTFRGYNIPDYVSIVPYFGGVFKSPKFFPEPRIFKPKRYLKDDKIDTSLPFIAFGMGRRTCIGEQFVRNCMFFLVTRLVSRYKIQSPDGQKLSVDLDKNSVVKKPQDFSVVLKERH